MFDLQSLSSGVNSVVPSPVVITADKDWYNDPQRLWQGSVIDDAVLVIVTINGKNPEKVPVINGKYMWSPAYPLGDGEYVLNFFAQDNAGNTSQPRIVNYNIDTHPPSKPIIEAIEDDVAGGIQNGASIKRNGYTNDDQPTVRGKAEKHSLVHIFDGKNELASVRANEKGDWQIEVKLPQEGTYTLSAVAEDRADNRSEPSAKWTFHLDTSKPDQAALLRYQDNVGQYQGEFGFHSATDDRRPELHGAGVQGEFVRVQYAGADGKWVSSATIAVDSRGQWQWTPPQDLAEGSWQFRVRSVDHAGNNSPWSATTTLEIDASITQPTLLHAWDNVGTPGNIARGAITDDPRLDFSGKAEAFSIVTLYADGASVGSVQANAQGNWQLTPDRNMHDGINNFSARASDAAGNVSHLSENYQVIYQPQPQFAKHSENWESRGNDNWVTGREYHYGELKVTEIKHGENWLGWHTGITTSAKTHNGYYHGRALTLMNNSVVKFDYGETDLFSFNYANLHNDNTAVKIFSPGGELLDTHYLAQSGTINYESSSYHFDYQAAAGKTIGYVEIHSAKDPAVYAHYWWCGYIKVANDVGWTLDTLNWGGGKSSTLSAPQNVQPSAPAADFHIIDIQQWLQATSAAQAVVSANVVIDGAEQMIDFSALSQHVTGMQKLDIAGTGDNVVQLDLATLLLQGEQSLFIADDYRQFLLDGDVGDRLHIARDRFTDGWQTKVENVEIGGQQWRVFTNPSQKFELLVNNDVEMIFS